MKIGILGSGNMGSTLAELYARQGHQIMIGSRLPERLVGKTTNDNITVTEQQQAVNNADVIMLAIPWFEIEATIQSLVFPKGKIVIDLTNPLSTDVSHLVIGGDSSAAEQIARWLPDVSIVKAYNTIYFENLINPNFSGERAQLFYCGDNSEAKVIVAELISELGFIPIDCGALTNAPYLEALAMLWIQNAFVENRGINFSFRWSQER